MSTIDSLANREYKYGFKTDIEADTIPRGLSEETIRLLSAKKQEPEWMLEWRLKAYTRWLEMTEPEWANVEGSFNFEQQLAHFPTRGGHIWSEGIGAHGFVTPVPAGRISTITNGGPTTSFMDPVEVDVAEWLRTGGVLYARAQGGSKVAWRDAPAGALAEFTDSWSITVEVEIERET